VSAVVVGTVEGLGRMAGTGSIGIDIRTDRGELISIPIAKDNLQSFAPLLFERVRISIERDQVPA
jgi:hypothetical protein